MTETLFALYTGLNVISFLLFGIDKVKAIRNKWRIRERTLMIWLVLGSYGGVLGMILFRHKIRKRKFVMLGGLLMIIIPVIYIYLQTNCLQVKHVELINEKVDSEIKIIQVSDLHGKVYGKENKKIVRKIEKREPDVIFITGDYIDKDTEDLSASISLAKAMIEITPNTYYISGNHDHANRLYRELIEELDKVGVYILDNKMIEKRIHGNAVDIYGVDDPSTLRDNIQKINHDIDESHINLLIAHAPEIVGKVDNGDFDYIFVGHTHGGQLQLPFIGPVVSHHDGFFPNLKDRVTYVDKGLYDLNSGTILYIDSGAGNSVVNFRIFNPVQISEILIKGK